jgi:hypothetical protein
MNKVIRPLSKWKKQNFEMWQNVYLPLFQDIQIESKKSVESYAYYLYCTFNLKGTDYLVKRPHMDSFYFTSKGNHTNKVLVSELGRLLLFGWYYNIEDWTNGIALYVYRAYKEREKNKETFNSIEVSKKIKHIRENIGYYYNNTSEVNLLLTSVNIP